MEPSTTTLSASVIALPVAAKGLRLLCKLLFEEQPSSKSWRGQRLEALRSAGMDAKDVFFSK
jgi:hypothetical protein